MNKIGPSLRQADENVTAPFAQPCSRTLQVRYARNERIYSEDDKACYWYHVISGTVRACNLLADGRRHVSAFHFEGDFFGFDDEGYLASAEAVTDIVANRYPRAALKTLALTDPALVQTFHGVTSKSAADLARRMTLLARKTALERVASFLLDMATRTEGGNRVDLPMTRHDIADHLGLTFETICRALAVLKKTGAIQIPENAQRIDLIDHAALQILQAGGERYLPRSKP